MADDLKKYLPAKTRKLLGGLTPKRKPRVTLDELNRGGLEAFRTRRAEVEEPEDKRPGYQKVFDVIDIPRNAVANVIGDIVGVDKSKLERATFGRPRVTTADILDKAGMKPGAARSILGFVGDVALDPLTYLTAGAATGTKLLQGAPKVSKAVKGMLTTAAKTGKFAKPLKVAVGAQRARRVGRAMELAKTTERTARRTQITDLAAKGALKGTRMPVADYSKLLSSQSGPILRRLGIRLKQGNAGALDLFAKHGLKGRVLGRIPFTNVTLGTITPNVLRRVFGKTAVRNMTQEGSVLGQVFKQTAKARAIEEGIANPEAWNAIREATGILKKGGKAAVAAGALNRAQKAQEAAAQDIAGQRAARMLPGPTAEGLAPSIKPILKSELSRARREAKNLGPVIPKQFAEKAVAKADTLRAEGVAATKAAQVAPDAPAIVRMFNRTQIGQAFDPRAAGAVNQLRSAKRSLFGPERSALRQQESGVRSMIGARAGAAASAAEAQFATQLAPVVMRLAKQTGKTPEEIKSLIYTLRETGINGENLVRMSGEYNPAIATFDEIKRLGINADPGVSSWLNSVEEWNQGLESVERGLGLGARSQKGYWSRQLTDPARQAIRTQEAGGKIKPTRGPGGKIGTPREYQLARAQMLTFAMKDGTVKRILSTQDPADIEAIKKAGGKLTGREAVSTEQMNAMSAQGMALTGGQGYQGEKFTGPLFKTDPIESIKARARQHQQAVAVAEIRDIIKPYQVKIDPKMAARDPRFAHLTQPKPPDPGSPFAELRQTGMFENFYPPQITEFINRMNDVAQSDDGVRLLLNATDKGLGIWKSLTLFSPAYAIRNVWQNFVGGLMAGGNPMAILGRAFSQEAKSLRAALVANDPSKLAGQFIRVAGRDVPLQALYNEGVRFNMAGAGRTANLMNPDIAGMQGQKYALQAANATRKKLSSSIFRANMFMEDHQKIGTWLHFMDKGLSPQDAALKTMMAMPDLSDLTKFEQAGLRRLFPWYAWMRKNGSLQLFHYLPKKPAFIASVPKMKDLAEGFRGDANVPDDLRPEWMREGMAAQVTGNKEAGTAFVPLSWTPFEETLAAGSLGVQPERAFKTAAGMVRPGIKFGAEMATGRNIFRGTEYQTGMGPLDYAKAVPQAVMGTSNTPLDTLLTARPIREATQRIPAMQTVGEGAVRTVLGGAFQPVSTRGGLAREYSELSERSKKLRNQIGRAQQAQDLPLARNLMVEFTRVQARMLKLGLPGVPKATQKMLQAQGVKQGPEAFPAVRK